MDYSYSTNFDAFWLYEPEPKQRYNPPDDVRLRMKELLDRCLRDTRNNPNSGGIPPKIKETPKMGYNNGYDDDRRSDAQKIDDAVREAIAKPRREAEIAKRVAAVTALEPLKDSPVGTVITFSRKNGNKDPFLYAAIRATEDRWFVTGDGYRSNGDCQGFDSLLTWLTTGDVLAENVQVLSAPAAK